MVQSRKVLLIILFFPARLVMDFIRAFQSPPIIRRRTLERLLFSIEEDAIGLVIDELAMVGNTQRQ